MDDKKLVFTVTPGRSGTAYLAKLLEIVPGVSAHHEPDPNFAAILRTSSKEADRAFAFVRDYKLPAIQAVQAPIYAETSHLTAKGFLEPMLLLGLRPALIFLSRPPREVAWSFMLRTTVPHRTDLGQMYLLSPGDPYVLPLQGWEQASDYQLCFWYALEMERRQLRYLAMARELGLPHHAILHTRLGVWEDFQAMLADVLGFTLADSLRPAHAAISGHHHNPNEATFEPPVEVLSAMEDAVWQRVALYEPFLREKVEQKYM
jgi:hypothetical protein